MESNLPEMIHLSLRDIEYLESQIGKKTVNELRREHGLQLVADGDMPYTDWLRRAFGYEVQLIH